MEGKPCELYVAPFDVRLNGLGDEDTTVVRPDLSVVCDPSKLDDKGCNGAPDLVMEILSPSHRWMDLVTKMSLYNEAAVREYWVVDPEEQSIQIYRFETKDCQKAIHGKTEKISTPILAGLDLYLKDIFGA